MVVAAEPLETQRIRKIRAWAKQKGLLFGHKNIGFLANNVGNLFSTKTIFLSHCQHKIRFFRVLKPHFLRNRNGHSWRQPTWINQERDRERFLILRFLLRWTTLRGQPRWVRVYKTTQIDKSLKFTDSQRSGFVPQMIFVKSKRKRHWFRRSNFDWKERIYSR